MVKITFPVMAAMLQTSSAALLIQGEDGISTLIQDANLDIEEQSATGSAYSIESCFRTACQTPAAKNYLVAACKKQGYPGCDKIAYHATYYTQNGNPTFKNTANTFTYGPVKVGYSSENVHGVRWNNQLDVEQEEEFKYKVEKTVSQTWENEVTTKVSDSLTVTEKAGLPEIVQEQISDTISVELKTSTTTSQTHETTQEWEEEETINVPANTCVEGCMIERDGDVTAPYTFTGHLTGTYSQGGGLWAAQCCYLRPGGSTDCSGLGSKSGKAGWQLTASPAYFVQTGTAAGKAQCKGFGTSGNDAVFTGSGKFKGGMGFNVSIATVVCGKTCAA